MIEKKFRAWDKKNKQLVYFNLYDITELNKNNIVEVLSEQNKLVLVNICDLDLNNSQQFTGITDKNGTEIYEGDNLRFNYHVSNDPEDFFGIVEYHDKILKIGYESDRTRFVGFILCCCKGTDEESFSTIPNLEDIEVVGKEVNKK